MGAIRTTMQDWREIAIIIDGANLERLDFVANHCVLMVGRGLPDRFFADRLIW